MDGHTGKKMERQRKKRFYNSIRQQIEFYLGDVNLSKDRFFSSLLQENPYIDIDVIMKCNKIKNLTTDPKHVVKSLKNSEILGVTEDGSHIYRKVPVQPVENADECTIYVEDLPFEADHDWLKNVFKDYGNIVYVSIPRYKNSNKIKGFAFLQFEKPENAEKALKAFRDANSCLSSNIAPTQLRSVQTFEGEKDIVVREHGEIDVDQIQCVVDENSTEPESAPVLVVNENKRKESTDDLEAAEVPRKKKRNANSESVEKQELVTDTGENAVEEEANTKANETIEEEEADEVYDENDEKVSRKRKRKRNKKKELVQTYGLHILSKNEWKKLRNKYLEEQRRRMHELKQQLRKMRWCQNENEPEPVVKESVEEEEGAELGSECRVKFTPGVIIKVRLDQPIKDVKHFKNDVKRYADVEYIDVAELGLEAYFRCASNDVANQVIALNKWPKMDILCGDEESAYWEKIKQDRKEKFDKKLRCNTRGKMKLIKKAESAFASHIKFPD